MSLDDCYPQNHLCRQPASSFSHLKYDASFLGLALLWRSLGSKLDLLPLGCRRYSLLLLGGSVIVEVGGGFVVLHLGDVPCLVIGREFVPLGLLLFG